MVLQSVPVNHNTPTARLPPPTLTMKAPKSPIGQRLIITHLDHIAQTSPHRTWGVQPRNNNDLSQGFEDVTFGTLSAAVDAAAWWLEVRLLAVSRSRCS